LDPQEFLLLKVLSGLILVCLVFLGFRFYFVHLQAVPKPGGTYIEGLVGQPRLVNPVLSSLYETDNDLAHLIFSGLLKYDKDQNLVPELAKEYSVSDDQLTYTFTLRDNLTWHDGKELTTQDVAFTIDMIKDPIIKSPLAGSFKNVKVEIVDTKTIKFILTEAYAPFLSITTFGILPSHIWGTITNSQFSLAEYNLKPIGSGPFIFKSLTKDKLGFVKTYTLERNDNYFQKPYLDKIIFKFFDNSQDAVTALRNSKIDGLVYNIVDWGEKIGQDNKKIIKHALYLPQYSALFINQENNSALESASVRKALKLAVNKDQVLQNALNGDGEIIAGPITEGMIGYNPDLVKNPANKDEAQKLLDEAGWKLESGKEFRTKGDKELTVIITTLDQLNYVQVAKEIQQEWQKVGIKVDLDVVAPEAFQSEIIKPKDYQILLYSVITGADPDPYPIWHSSQKGFTGLNLSAFEDKQADKLLSEARTLSNYDERNKRYQEFQKILDEKIPAIFLYNPHYNYFINRSIKGVDLLRISIPQDRFANITDWYIKTSRKFK